MVNIVNTAKSAYKALFESAGKGAGKYKMAGTPRLFSIRKDPAIGTEIRNNITGTRYFSRSGLVSGNTEMSPFVTVHRADGSYSSMPAKLFDNLYAQLKHDPKAWNPVIKSDPCIGKELFVNNPICAGRYFKSAASPDGNLITKIESNGHYQSMRPEEFDNMILNLLG